MIHYHGGPITPDTSAIKVWSRGHAFVSFAYPQQVALAAEHSQSFAFDNGAYTFWKQGKSVDWREYYAFVQEWRFHPGFDWAIIPDVIDGTEAENDALLASWPLPKHCGVPVWHVNESITRLWRLATEWPRVCIGSSGQYDVRQKSRFLARMREVLPLISTQGQPICKLHGLRMLNPAIFTELPLSSADSTNIAQNVNIDVAWRGTYQPRSKDVRAIILRDRIEHYNSKCRL